MNDSLPSLRLKGAVAGQPSGAIVLVGDPMTCLALSEKMMKSDEFDNVDARPVVDGLPDFAGETIVSLLDFSHPPLDSLRAEGRDSLIFREIAVRSALAALDSSVNCKVLVVCSPQLSQKGGEDVVDLFSKIGCEVPVIFSKDTTFSFTKACFLEMRDKKLFTHDIAYPKARLLTILGGTEGEYSPALRFDEDLVPEAFADTLGVFAPDTYISYVQNKHHSRGN